MQRHPHNPLLEICELSKNFGQTAVLCAVNLQLAPASRTAIMGPSGSGKSTLLNCIAGLQSPDSGSVRLDGTPIAFDDAAATSALRRRKIASIFQFFHLLPTLTVAENVEFPLLLEAPPPAAIRNQKVMDLLASVGMQHRAKAFPETLSGGEMQRVAIARALVTDPLLLLADEPTGSLDARNSERILECLVNLVRERQTTLLMVTHDPEAAAICPQCLTMRDGHLAPQPSPASA